MPITLPNIPPGKQMLDDLAAAGVPVIVNFSRGKDSIALWLELADRGVEVIPVHKSIVPGMRWVREDLDRYEQHFQTRIHDLPSESFYRMLNNLVFQPPERCVWIEGSDLPVMTREDFDAVVRGAYGEPDTWITDGVRATDSATRRMAIMQHGAIKPRTRRQSPVWDLSKKEIYAVIDRSGLVLGPDYQWFGRSWDGIRADYLGPIAANAPDDYLRILEWFPLARLELLRVTEAIAGRM